MASSTRGALRHGSSFLPQQLHRGGPFINSLLHLEELGFRSSSPNIKKIAFIAWKSLIDNFALNPGEPQRELPTISGTFLLFNLPWWPSWPPASTDITIGLIDFYLTILI